MGTVNTFVLKEKSDAMETVLITGASRGIGLELTRHFLQLGYRVISTYRGKPSSELSSVAASGALSLIELEVIDSQSIATLSRLLADTKIDILINNAGIIGPKDQALDTVEPVDWLNTFAVNTISPLLISRALIGNLERSANPRIIALSSMMGALSRESAGMYAYRSSKAALNKVMQVLALELKAQGIIVCPIHPGWVQTNMGGPNAEISARESAAGIVEFVRNLTMAQSGRFFTWEGKPLAW